jgi:putative ABC transport system permease protein
MRAIDRKLFRDLWNIKGQAVAISLVIASGIAVFVMYLSTFDSLRLTQSAYYDRFRFADVFLMVKRAPGGLRERIADIPGVSRVDTRVVVDVSLDVRDLTEPATGRLIGISVPHRTMLNDLFLRRGRFPASGQSDEVLVSEAFALARNLIPGDTVGAIINGRRRELNIVGVALSPEYVYSIRPGELIPDNKRFGIFWMDGRALASAFNMEGAFNSATLQLERGASVADVIARVDRLVAPYGGLGALPRALQTSHWYLDNEIAQLQGAGLWIPSIFLAVAAFLLNVVLTRVVAVQREQIAMLKAVGYSNLELARHYLAWALVIAACGTAIGTTTGGWLGSLMVRMYNDFFRFPILTYRMQPWVLAAAAGISFAAATLGALGAVGRAIRLPPAEAMRPEPPARYRESWLERAGLKRFLPHITRMIVRNIGRHPVRTATSVIGIASAAAMLIVGSFFIDSIDVLMDTQFFVTQRQDVSVNFAEPASGSSLHELSTLPGVMHVEPMRAVPVRLRFGPRSRQTAITALVAEPRLNRVVDITGGPLRLPPDGLVLSTTLSDILDAHPGDSVTIEVLEGRRPVREVPVVGLVEEYMGASAYMEIGAVRRLLREDVAFSGAFLDIDEGAAANLYRRLKQVPRVAGVSLKATAIENFIETLAETMYVMIMFNVIFSGIIAFGVVYNAARIALAERSYELASLRVLGFTRAEISAILLGELAVLTLAAIPIGLVLGQLGAAGLVALFNTELYRFPLAVSSRTRAAAACTVLIAAAISSFAVRRKLDRLNLVAVLKTRE